LGGEDRGREPAPRVDGWSGVVAGIEPRFDVRSRENGRAHFDAGRVELGEWTHEQALGQVSAEPVQRVRLGREVLSRGVRYDTQCTCAMGQREQPCEHVFALALQVEASLRAERRAAARPAEPPKVRSSRDRLARLRARTLAAPGLPRGDERAPWRVLYRLAGDADGEPDQLRLSVLVQRRRRDGQWGTERFLDERLRRELELEDETDRRVLALLGGARERPGTETTLTALGRSDSHRFRLDADNAALVLPEIVATGRARWSDASAEDPPLALDAGGPWQLVLRFERGPRPAGGQIHGLLERQGSTLHPDQLRAATAGGFWLSQSELGRFQPQAAAGWLAELVSSGPIEVPAELEGAWLAALAEVAPAAVAGLVDLRAVAPRSQLRIEGARGGLHGARKLPAQIRFRYGEAEVELDEEGALVTAPDGTWIAQRDARAERAALAQFVSAGGEAPPARGASATVTAARVAAVARTLLAQGWQVEAEGRRWRLHTDSSLRVRSGIDWFDLEGDLRFGEQTVGLPALLAAAEEQSAFVELHDGSLGLLPERWLAGQELLQLARSVEGEALRFGSGQALLLDALLAERDDVELDERYAAVRARLLRAGAPSPRHEPVGFRGELRPYQREGLGWLDFLAELGLGGCLADDMGLGKTVQVLALLEQRRAAREGQRQPRRPSLVVAPSSLVFNWLDEAARFTPDLAALAYTGPERAALLPRLRECDLVVTNYALLRRDVLELREVEWDLLILDEAQAIKNAGSQVAKASRVLPARQRFALSGTPLENHLGELWSLFEFLNPGMLGRSTRFRQLVKQAEPGADGHGLQLVARAVRPFVLRRRKDQVLADLPEKTEQQVHVELGEQERLEYDELRDHYRAALLPRIGSEPGAVGRQSIHVLEALLRLRQAACHRGLIDKRRRAGGSAKLDQLLEMLGEVVESGAKALVFSQFVQFLTIVREALEARGLAYEYLDGQTVDRRAPVERFQSVSGAPVFLVSLKAGGTGLNLTAADFVFLLDPWWNPAVEAQAIDRAHRIGRTRPVVAYRLIAVDTVEERVLELQAGKRELAAAVLDGSGGSVAELTREDLERLLS
jgi:superfamily II DNA or RNA helicase